MFSRTTAERANAVVSDDGLFYGMMNLIRACGFGCARSDAPNITH
jgi:hypothetical protein